MTKFTPRHERFQVSYRDKSLPAIFCRDTSASEQDFTNALATKTTIELGAEIAKTRVSLMLACDQLKDPSLIIKIKKLADTGIRIYLLLGDEKANKEAIDTLSGRCLIRTGIKQSGAVLIRDHATSEVQATLLTSGTPLENAEQFAWATTVEPEQVEDAFRSFCKLFWEHASGEYLLQNQKQPSIPHPDGHIITNHSHHLSGTLRDSLSDTLASLSAASGCSLSAPGNDFKLLMSSDSNEITVNARSGVALTESAIPALLFSPSTAWLMPNQTDFSNTNWCLKLSNTQRKKLYNAFTQVFEQASWQFKDNLTLADLSPVHQIRFIDDTNTIYDIETVREIQLNDIQTDSFDSFLNDDVRDLTSSCTNWQKAALAHVINYQVLIHPPYCPANAQPDDLYKKWEKTEITWQQQIQSLLARLTQIEREQDGVTDKLKGFIKGFLLGQKQSVKALRQELMTLQNCSIVQASPSEREQYRQRLYSLVQQIEKRADDTVAELDKAQQQQQWEQKRHELQAACDDAVTLLNKTKAVLKSHEAENQHKLTEISKTFARTWSEAVKSLSETQIKALLQHVSSNSAAAENSPPELKSHSADNLRSYLIELSAEQAQALKANIKERVWHKEFKVLERVLEDYILAKNKLSRDLDLAKRTVEKNQTALSQAEQALQHHGVSFVYKAKSNALDQQLGLKNNNTDTIEFNWPTQDLPAAGTDLRTHQQKRYLVVFEKIQLEQAQKDAKRLNALLVCDKETANA